jgi:hypothetical protein
MGSAESKANIESAIANARLGDINQVTPYGTVTYSFGSPGGAAGAPAGASAGTGAGPYGTPPPAGLAWANQVRQRLNLPPLVPGTPQYAQWLLSQNQQQGPYGAGGPGAAQGGVGRAGPPSGGTYGGGSLGGGPGARGAGSNPSGPPGSW